MAMPPNAVRTGVNNSPVNPFMPSLPFKTAPRSLALKKILPMKAFRFLHWQNTFLGGRVT
jgi:hypothetical protein